MPMHIIKSYVFVSFQLDYIITILFLWSRGLFTADLKKNGHY